MIGERDRMRRALLDPRFQMFRAGRSTHPGIRPPKVFDSLGDLVQETLVARMLGSELTLRFREDDVLLLRDRSSGPRDFDALAIMDQNRIVGSRSRRMVELMLQLEEAGPRPVGPWSRMLRAGLMPMLEETGQASTAYRFAKGVAYQTAPHFHRGGEPDGVPSTFGALLEALEVEQRQLEATADELIESIRAGLFARLRRIIRSDSCTLRAHEREGQLTVALVVDEKEIEEQSADEFCEAITASASRQLNAWRADRQRSSLASGDMDRDLPAEVSEAILEAKRKGEIVVETLESGQGDAPWEIVLELHYGDQCAPVLSFRRALREFVLENKEARLFYFPPVQLVAMVQLPLSSAEPCLLQPSLRMPAGGAHWVHPYTGGLHSELSARCIASSRSPAMFPISDAAKALFPRLAQGSRDAASGRFCLSGHQDEMGRLEEQLQDCLRFGRVSGIAEVVQHVWKIARLGLVRAHQENASPPLTELSSEEMLYPIADRGLLAGTSLEGRISPYRRNSLVRS